MTGSGSAWRPSLGRPLLRRWPWPPGAALSGEQFFDPSHPRPTSISSPPLHTNFLSLTPLRQQWRRRTAGRASSPRDCAASLAITAAHLHSSWIWILQALGPGTMIDVGRCRRRRPIRVGGDGWRCRASARAGPTAGEEWRHYCGRAHLAGDGRVTARDRSRCHGRLQARRRMQAC